MWDSQAPIFYISIHASAKEATTKPVFFFTVVIFQSTPPRRRRLAQNVIGCFHFDFNPRLREGGDNTMELKEIESIISIHASAKEATSSELGRINKMFISIHASAKEATNIWEELPVNKFNFNPRLREGGDDFLSRSYYTTLLFQSTPPRRRRPNKYNYRLPL